MFMPCYRRKALESLGFEFGTDPTLYMAASAQSRANIPVSLFRINLKWEWKWTFGGGGNVAMLYMYKDGHICF